MTAITVPLPSGDPLTLTREEAATLRSRLSSALRTTRGGGRPPSCECGTCALCRRRVRQRNERANRAAKDLT